MNNPRKVLEHLHLDSVLRGLFTAKGYEDYAERVDRKLPGVVNNSEKMDRNKNTKKT